MITQKSFLRTFKAIENVVNGFARMITNIFTFSITEVAPMVAPLPPAFSIYTAMSERLHVPFYVAVIAAIAIEIIGLFSSKVSIRCYQWNSSKSRSEPSVPQGLSILMTSIFFVVVLLLALTVELAPGLTALVIPGFVLIAISTYFNLAIHVNLERLEAAKAGDLELRQEKSGINTEIKKAKADLEALANDIQKLAGERAKLTKDVGRLEKQSAARTNGQTNGFGPQNVDKARAISGANAKVRITQRRQNVLALKAENLTNEAIARELDVSLSTVKNDLKQLNGSAK